MIVRPATIDDLKLALAEAPRHGERIQAVEFQGFDRVLEHHPEDMTATVQAGMTLAAFQHHLRSHRQWLPVDPPSPDKLTIGQLISTNASGPRRFGEGTIRDYLIGITVVLADGRVIRSGGKVVKNVAGYDLLKLFIGSRDSLGIILEATFKVKPLPEAEAFVAKRFASTEEARKFLDAIWDSPLTPNVLDLHKLDSSPDAALTLVAGFAGTNEDVEYQVAAAAELGISEAGSLEHEATFWSSASNLPVKRMSVLPSDLLSAIGELGAESWIARAGNGLIYYRGGKQPMPSAQLPLDLMKRVKETFDPNAILPELNLSL